MRSFSLAGVICGVAFCGFLGGSGGVMAAKPHPGTHMRWPVLEFSPALWTPPADKPNPPREYAYMDSLKYLVGPGMDLATAWTFIDGEVLRKDWPQSSNYVYYATEMMGRQGAPYPDAWTPLLMQAARSAVSERRRVVYAEMLNHLNQGPRVYWSQRRLPPGEALPPESIQSNPGYTPPPLLLEWQEVVRRAPGSAPEFRPLSLDTLRARSFMDSVDASDPQAARYASFHHSYDSYRKMLPKPGLYRAFAYDDKNYTPFYVESSALELLVKQDAEKVLVWVSSFAGSLPGPYALSVFNEKNGVAKLSTDAQGFAIFALSDSIAQGGIRIVAEKQGHRAFAHLDGVDPDNMRKIARVPVSPWLTTDKPLYRPGQAVRIQALLAPGQEGTLYVSGPKYKGHSWPAGGGKADKFGQFTDSLALSAYPAGDYTLRLLLPGENLDDDAASGSTAEFRVAEAALASAQAELSVAAERVLAGDPVRLQVRAQYATGSPLAGRPVRLTVQATPLAASDNSWSEPARQMHWQWQANEEPREVATFDTLLDAAGRLDFAFQKTRFAEPTQLTFYIEASDQAGQALRDTVEASVFPWASRAKLSLLSPLSPTGPRSAMVRHEILVPGQADASARVRISWGQRDSLLNLPPDSQMLFTFPDKAPVPSAPLRLDVLQGKKAIVSDSAGEFYGFFLLETDRESYAPGDTVRVKLYGGPATTPLLLLVEGRKLHVWQNATLSNGFLQWRFVVTEDMGNNVLVSVLRPSHAGWTGTNREIAVVRRAPLLARITGSHTGSPGDTLPLSVRITNSRGQGVSAAFSVTLRDQALRAYDTAGIPEPPRLDCVNTLSTGSVLDSSYLAWMGLPGIPLDAYSSWDHLYSGIANVLRGSREAGFDFERCAQVRFSRSLRGGEFQAGFASAPMDRRAAPQSEAPRAFFRPEGVWMGRIVTDAQGKATLRVPLPAHAATWDLVLRGSSAKGELLFHRDSLTTTGSAQLELMGSQTLVVGDTLEFKALLHNQRAQAFADTVRLVIREGDSTLSIVQPAQWVKAAPQSVVPITWKIAARQSGNAVLQAQSASLLSAPRGLVIQPYALVRTRTEFSVLDSANVSAQFALGPLGNVDKQNSYVEFTVGANPYAELLRNLERGVAPVDKPDVLHSLLGNSLLANLALIQAMATLGKRDVHLESNLQRQIDQALAQILPQRKADTVWGESYAAGSTLQIAEAFLLMDTPPVRPYLSAQQVRIAQKNLQSLWPYVQRARQPNPQHPLSYRVWALRLAAERAPDSACVQDFRALLALPDSIKPDPLTLYSLARLLRQNDVATKIRDTILAQTRCVESAQGTACYWPDPQYKIWNTLVLRRTLYLLQALAEHEPHHPMVPRLLRALAPDYDSIRRSYRYFGTSLLHAIARYTKFADEETGVPQVELWLNGKRQGLFAAGSTHRIPAAQLQGDNVIRLRFQGSGRAYTSARMVRTVNENPLGAKPDGLVLQQSASRTALRMGDTVGITLTLKLDQDYQNLRLAVPLPAGCVLDPDAPPRWPDPRNFERISWKQENALLRFTAPQLSQGSYTFHYTLRTQEAGTFHALPATAQAKVQGAPDFALEKMAESAEIVLRVKR